MNVSLAHPKTYPEALSPVPESRRLVLPMGIALAALIGFEVFNYSTLAFSLKILFGPLPGVGLIWIKSLSLGICAIDLFGVIYLTSNPLRTGHSKVNRWILVAWFLNQFGNLLITWWGVATAIAIQQARTGLIIDAGLLIKTLPVFLVVLLSVVRVLIIGVMARLVSPQRIPDPIRNSDLAPADLSENLSSGYPRFHDGGSIVPPLEFDRQASHSKMGRTPAFRDVPVPYQYR